MAREYYLVAAAKEDRRAVEEARAWVPVAHRVYKKSHRRGELMHPYREVII
jgi:hypothetical protein